MGEIPMMGMGRKEVYYRKAGFKTKTSESVRVVPQAVGFLIFDTPHILKSQMCEKRESPARVSTL